MKFFIFGLLISGMVFAESTQCTSENIVYELSKADIGSLPVENVENGLTVIKLFGLTVKKMQYFTLKKPEGWGSDVSVDISELRLISSKNVNQVSGWRHYLARLTVKSSKGGNIIEEVGVCHHKWVKASK